MATNSRSRLYQIKIDFIWRTVVHGPYLFPLTQWLTYLEWDQQLFWLQNKPCSLTELPVGWCSFQDMTWIDFAAPNWSNSITKNGTHFDHQMFLVASYFHYLHLHFFRKNVYMYCFHPCCHFHQSILDPLVHWRSIFIFSSVSCTMDITDQMLCCISGSCCCLDYGPLPGSEADGHCCRRLLQGV